MKKILFMLICFGLSHAVYSKTLTNDTTLLAIQLRVYSTFSFDPVENRVRCSHSTLDLFLKKIGCKRFFAPFDYGKSSFNNSSYEESRVNLRDFNCSLDSVLIYFQQLITNEIAIIIDKQEGSSPINCSTPYSRNDPSGWTQPNGNVIALSSWHLNSVGAECAWQVTTGNPAIKIGFIDEWFDASHEDLAGQLTVIPVNGASVNEPYEERHGTKTSSIAVAKANNGIGMAGLAYNSKAVGYSCTKSRGSVFDNIDGIAMAVTDGIRILNCSFSPHFHHDRDVPEKDMLTYVKKGVFFSYSAGRFINEVQYSSYWDIPGIMVTTGLDSDHKLGPTNMPRSLTNDLCAPSKNFIVANKAGDPWGLYKSTDGTSAAAPLVSATVALMRSLYADLTPAECECVIKTTALPVADAALYPGRTGAGRLNTEDAVLLLSQGLKGDITSNIVYAGTTRYVVEDLTIKSGYQLTLTNSTLKVRKGVRIIVEPGARLRLFNSTITNLACATTMSMWGGIYAKGAGWGSSYDASMHGVVECDNSTIENAVVGIELGDGAAAAGGVVRIQNNSRIKNCRFGLKFNPFSVPTGTNPNLITNSSFICDKYLLDYDEQGVNTHIWTNSVKRLMITGCSFSNTLPNSGASLNVFPYVTGINPGTVGRGRGIGAWNSSFSVQPSQGGGSMSCPYMPTGTPCSFTGLSIGVHALGITSEQANIRIAGNTFTDNDDHIVLVSTFHSIVYNNTLTWSSAYNSYKAASRNSGISLAQTKNFLVSDNTINIQFSRSTDNVFGLFAEKAGYQLALPWDPLANSGFSQSRVVKNSYNMSLFPASSTFGFGHYLNDINSFISVCNNYSNNLNYGWFVPLNSRLNIAQNYINDSSAALPKESYVFNNFNSCYSGSGMYSLYSVPGDGFWDALNQPVYRISTASGCTPPISLSCLNNAQIQCVGSPFPTSQVNCPVGKFYSEESIYCPGPDKLPGTDDDGIAGSDDFVEYTSPFFIVMNIPDLITKWGAVFPDKAVGDVRIIEFADSHFNGNIRFEKPSDAGAGGGGPVSFTSISEPAEKGNGLFSIQPNPSHGLFTLIPGNNSDKSYKITLYDQLGNLVKTSGGLNGQYTLDISDMPDGIYIVSIAHNGSISNHKIVKVAK